MAKRKPPRRTKHNYLVTFISDRGDDKVTSHRSINMTNPWSAKNFPEIVEFLYKANPGHTHLVITNVFYMGRS